MFSHSRIYLFMYDSGVGSLISSLEKISLPKHRAWRPKPLFMRQLQRDRNIYRCLSDKASCRPRFVSLFGGRRREEIPLIFDLSSDQTTRRI